MINEYQVFYTGIGSEVLHTLVRAETPNEAESILEKAGKRVSSVGPGRPVIDWNQDTWDSEEACLFLKCKPTKLAEMMGNGVLPKARNGRPLFKKAWLERAVEKRMDIKPEHEKEAA